MQEEIANRENLEEEKSKRREVLEERREVLKEMKELAYQEAPKPKEDWDLVWVISGPPSDIKAESTKEERNESRKRMETGLKVAREVTAKRLGKNAEEVTIDDILNNGPSIYWNATDRANNNLRQRIAEGLFEERYKFPGGKIIVSTDKDIEHTRHQFEKFPEELAIASRKIVFVSDIYHLPRVIRYLDADYNKIPLEKVVIYPSEPRKVPVGKALAETRKIPEYTRKGILPKKSNKK